MKNSIKIITILGIVASFFPVYSMELSNRFLVSEFELEMTNPLLHQMRGFYIAHSGQTISKDHSLYQNKSLALILTVPRIIVLRDEEKKIEETLETVCEAVCDGALVTSEWAAKITGDSKGYFSIFFSQEPTSIFTSAEDLFENYPLWTAKGLFSILSKKERNVIFETMDDLRIDKRRVRMEAPFRLKHNIASCKQKKILWTEAVFRGHHKRQENFDRMSSELIGYVREGGLEEVPKVVMDLIVSCLPKYHINKENEALIRQAKQKFDERTTTATQSR